MPLGFHTFDARHRPLSRNHTNHWANISLHPDHFIVPEFQADQEFSLRSRKPIDEFLEAKALGIKTRPVILGPISFLRLGKAAKGQNFDTLTLLDRLIPVYENLLR